MGIIYKYDSRRGGNTHQVQPSHRQILPFFLALVLKTYSRNRTSPCRSHCSINSSEMSAIRTNQEFKTCVFVISLPSLPLYLLSMLSSQLPHHDCIKTRTYLPRGEDEIILPQFHPLRCQNARLLLPWLLVRVTLSFDGEDDRLALVLAWSAIFYVRTWCFIQGPYHYLPQSNLSYLTNFVPGYYTSNSEECAYSNTQSLCIKIHGDTQRNSKTMKKDDEPLKP